MLQDPLHIRSSGVAVPGKSTRPVLTERFARGPRVASTSHPMVCIALIRRCVPTRAHLGRGKNDIVRVTRYLYRLNSNQTVDSSADVLG